jgi:hypothetical protein
MAGTLFRSSGDLSLDYKWLDVFLGCLNGMIVFFFGLFLGRLGSIRCRGRSNYYDHTAINEIWRCAVKQKIRHPIVIPLFSLTLSKEILLIPWAGLYRPFVGLLLSLWTIPFVVTVPSRQMFERQNRKKKKNNTGRLCTA